MLNNDTLDKELDAFLGADNSTPKAETEPIAQGGNLDKELDTFLSQNKEKEKPLMIRHLDNEPDKEVAERMKLENDMTNMSIGLGAQSLQRTKSEAKSKIGNIQQIIPNSAASVDARLAIIDEKLAKLQGKVAAESSRDAEVVRSATPLLGSAHTGIDPSVMAALASNETLGGKAIRDARDKINSIRKNNLTSGIAEGFDWVSAVTMGLNDLASGAHLNSVLKKKYEGKELTEREQLAYDIYEITQELESIQQETGGASLWNTIGKGVGFTAEVASSMPIGVGLVGSGVKMTSLGAKAGLKLTKEAFKEGVVSGLKRGLIETSKVAGRSAANIARAEAVGFLSAPITPTSWSAFIEKRNEQFKLNNGNLEYAEKAAWKDLADTWIEQANEISSEVMGSRIATVVGGAAKNFGRLIRLDKVADKIGIGAASRTFMGLRKPAYVREFEKSIGFTGFLGEPLSEFWGDVASESMKSMLTDNGDFSKIMSSDYWLQTLGVCSLYGGAVSIATAPATIAEYKKSNIYGVSKARGNALTRISDRALRNELLSISAIDDINIASKELATLPWDNYSKTDIASAMDFIRADYVEKVLLGDANENKRMQMYEGVALSTSELAYRGQDGNDITEDIVSIDTDSGRYVVISGVVDANTDNMLQCMDANGNIVPIHASKIQGVFKHSLQQEMGDRYQQMFASQVEQDRQADIIDTYKDMKNPAREDVQRVMNAFGVKEHRAGESVTLVDGRQGIVDSFEDDGVYIINVPTEQGAQLLSVPFYDVLAEGTTIAEAQSMNYAMRTFSDMELAMKDDLKQSTSTESVTTKGFKTTKFAVNEPVYAPNGKQAIIREINEDGTYIIDYNTNPNARLEDMQLDVVPEGDLSSGTTTIEEDVVAQGTPEAQVEMEATPYEAEVKDIPTQEDGSVDYNAISDPKQYAELFAKDMGGVEIAATQIQKMADATRKEVEKLVAKGESLVDANEVVRNNKAIAALNERLSFYGDVLNTLTPPQPQQKVEEDAPNPKSEKKVDVGLVANEYSEKLPKAQTEAIDKMAKLLGLSVVFVDSVEAANGAKANADIKGNEVRIAYENRDRAIDFLVGHEFTHRMQDLSPEQYAAFKESVKQFMGEEAWNALVEHTLRNYRRQNVPITRDAVEDEVVADYVGTLVNDHKAFDAYLASLDDKSLLQTILDVLRAIRDFIFNAEVEGMKDITDMIKKLDTLIASAAEAQAKGVEAKNDSARLSLKVVNGLRDALSDYNINGDIASFVNAVRVVNNEFGKHSYITGLIMDYDEEGDAEWFVERVKRIVGDANEDYAPYTAGGVRYSIVSDQIEHLFNEAVAGNLTGKPIAIGALTQDGKDYLEKLSGLKFKDKVSFTLNPSDLVHIHNDHFEGNEKDKGNNIPLTTLDIKRIVDVISFPTAIMYGKEKNSGRNLFYFLMDSGAGTYNLLEIYSNKKGNLSTKTYYKTKKDAAQRVMELNSSLLPTSETYSGAILSDTKIPQIFEIPKVSTRNFLITPEMDASYLSAVERGDMATAQQMVMEAAKLAMPNTKVVDDDGNPKVVYHGDRKKARYIFSTDTFFTPDVKYAKRYTNSTGEVYATYLDIKKPFDIRDKKAYDIFTEFRGGRKPVATTTGAMDWAEYSYEDLQEYVEEVAPNEYDGFILDEGADPDGNGGVVHRGLSYVPFSPNQIKSADPVTYDDAGNVIPLSERFNPNKEDIRYSLSAPTFYSNAEYAVRNIKQEKATPEQWLKMIEKNGGLKAGEDKWLGLSDWLKASTTKTLTKDEVLQYIADNNFVIEEVEYSDVERFTDRDIYDTDEFTGLLSSLQIYDEDDNASFNIEEYNRLRESNADFEEGFSLDYWGESLDVKDPVAAARYLGLTEGEAIHGTRLEYTTAGLENKREIALVVPTIEPYNAHDEIHFGDAGEGRAVAWIRFGETEAPKNVPMHQRVEEFDEPFETATGLNFYAPKNGNGKFAKDYVLFGKLKDGSEGYIIYIDRKPISKHDTLEEARDAMNEYYKANPRMVTRYERVLVIDEIQSKRHQDGREKGYRDEAEIVRVEEAENALRELRQEFNAYRDNLKEKYDYNSIEGSPVTRAKAFMEMMTEEERARFTDLTTKVREAENMLQAARGGQLRMEDIAFTEEDGTIVGRYGDLESRFVIGTSREAVRQDLQSQMRQQRINDVTKRVPSAPFEKNWAELAMKRMLRYAAENGFDKVAWTTGEQQAERYDLGTKINHIHVIPSAEERYVSISPIGGRIIETPTAPDSDIIVSGEYEGKTLSEVYGKALAEKIMSVEVGSDERISGDGLRIGGEGMKAFYDQMLPSFMNKYGKKWGVKVGEVTMPSLEENNTMHSVDVTDAMRESVMQGQPRFALQDDIDDALYERAAMILELCNKANSAYGIKPTIVVAATREDFVNIQLETGYTNPDRDAIAAYLDDDDIILLNSLEINTEGELANALTHENTHSITHTPEMWNRLAVIHNSLNGDDIRELQEKYLPDYNEVTTQSVLDEIISNFVAYLSTRKEDGVYLLRGYLLGSVDIDTLTSTVRNAAIKKYGDKYAYMVDALLPFLTDILKIQKENYEGKDTSRSYNFIRHTRGYVQQPDTSRGVYVRGDVGTRTERAIDRRGQKEESSERSSDYRAEVTRNSLSDVISAEEQVRIFMRNKHLKAKQAIRKKYRTARQVAKLDYNEKRAARQAKIRDMRTNSAKVEYILGEVIEATMPYEHQAYAKIARGEIKMPWETLSAEIGVKKGEKRIYAGITKGANPNNTFDSVVHQWWEELNGYENNIDSQDLRNALIDALRTAPSSTRALQELNAIYDKDSATLNDTMDDLERMEAEEIASEDTRYAEEERSFNADKSAHIAAFERDAAFYSQLEVMDATVVAIRKRLEKTKMVLEVKQQNKYYKGMMDARAVASRERLEKAEMALEMKQQNRYYKGLMEAIAEVKQAVKDVISSKTIDNLDRNELRRIIDKIDNVRSLSDADAIVAELENITLTAMTRHQNKDLKRMLKLRLPNGVSVEEWVGEQVKAGRMSKADADAMLRDKWKGRNASGVNVAKWVDNTTAEIMRWVAAKIGPALANDKLVVAESEIKANTARIEELEQKSINTANNTALPSERFTDADEIELRGRILYGKFLNAMAYQKSIAILQDERAEIYEHYHKLSTVLNETLDRIERIDDEKRSAEETEFNADKSAHSEAARDRHLARNMAALVEVKRQYKEAMDATNEAFATLLTEGREALSLFRREQEAHKAMIINMGCDALDINPRTVPNTPTTMEKIKAYNRAYINAPYYTFQTTLKEIDRRSPNGEGRFYNYFMNGVINCTDKMISQHSMHIEQVAEQMRKILDIKGSNDADIISKVIDLSDSTPLLTVIYGGEDAVSGIKAEKKVITLSNALYIIAMWRQPQYRDSMIYNGFTEEMYDKVYDAVLGVDERYIKFINWVNESLLPETRLVYDKVHQEMFGTSMANERNYFPAKLVGYENKEDVSVDDVGNLPSTITGAIVARVHNRNMIDLNMNYFKVLMGHLQEMDQWSSFAPITRDLNALASNTEFRSRCNAIMPGLNADRSGKGSLFSNFKTTASIAVNCYRPKSTALDDLLLAGTRGWAGANITWRASTAIKQLASSPVFAVYALDPVCLGIWAKNSAATFVTQRKTLEWAIANSPMFKKRWEGKFAGMDIFNTKVNEDGGYGVYDKVADSKIGRGVKAFDDAITKFASDWGMTPNAFIDAMTVANGIKTVYEYELHRFKKRNGNKPITEEQKREAIIKAEIAFNATQQSSEGAFVSEWQSNRTFATRLITVYQNSAYGFHRLKVSALNEFAKQLTRNSEYKANIREVYGREANKVLRDARLKAGAQLAQGIVGDLLFVLMGGAGTVPLFRIFSGGDDEGEEQALLIEAFKGAVFNITLGGFAGGNILSSLTSGYTVSFGGALDNLVKDIQSALDYKIFSLPSVYHGLNIVARYRYGVDFDTLANIAMGIEGLIEGAATGEGKSEAVMKMLNVPQSQINIVAGKRRPGETIQEYITRILRTESIGSVPEVDDEGNIKADQEYWDSPFTPKKYYARQYKSDYETAYRRNVIVGMADVDAYNSYLDTEGEYKKVVEAMGWTPDATPNKKATKGGVYVAPIEGLGYEDYKEVKRLATRAANFAKKVDRFVGTDENYYKLSVEMIDAKQELINKYNEL